MRRASVVRCLFVLLLLIVGCGESSTEPPPQKAFSLEIEVATLDGDLVAGLDVFVVPVVEGIELESRSLARRSRCAVSFRIPQRSRCDLRVYDVTGAPVAVLVDGLSLAAGEHRATYADDTTGPGHIGVLPLRFVLIVRDEESGEILLEQERWAVRAVWPDLERTSLGTTDSTGRWRSEDRRLAPSLYEYPTFDATNESGEIVGSFTIDSSVLIMARDANTGAFVATEIALADGPNRISMPWQPQTSSRRDMIVRGVEATEVPAPSDSLQLGPIYPNPFN